MSVINTECSNKLQLLLLSGSKASGGLGADEKPGFLEWAKDDIKRFCADKKKDGKPVLIVPYARPDGMPEGEYYEIMREAFEDMGLQTVCAPSDGKITPELLNDVGAMFVGGGHTPTLLHKLQQSINGGSSALENIRRAVKDGLPYMGSSAGSLIACPSIKTNNDMPGPQNDIMDLRSLGLIDYQLNCHYMDSSMETKGHHGETRDTRLKEVVEFNPGMIALGLYEGQALRVDGNKHSIITSQNKRGEECPVFAKGVQDSIPCPEGDTDITQRLKALSGKVEAELTR